MDGCPACNDAGWIQDEPGTDGWFCDCEAGTRLRIEEARLLDRILVELLMSDDSLAERAS